MPLELGSAMTEEELKTIVQREIEDSQGYFGGKLTNERRQSLDYYNSELFGDEVEGRSQVVTSDVLETVETAMAMLIEIFASGDQVIVFEPSEREDEEFADQATDYVNHILLKDNPGYRLIHDWIKDGLLSKNGFLKVYWDESERKKLEVGTKRPELEFVDLVLKEQERAQAEKIDFDIVEKKYFVAQGNGVFEEIDDDIAEELSEAGAELFVDYKIERTETVGRVIVEPCPPEEILISRRARDIQWSSPGDAATFIGHRTRRTESELIEMGYDEEVVKKLPSYGEGEYNQERIARHSADDEYTFLGDRKDRGMREIWIVETYIRVDFDGDGLAELRKVTVAGESGSSAVLDNEEVDDHPFVTLTPIKMPHKVFGKALADLTKDVQRIKSTLFRQILDNAYSINNNRTAVNQRVSLADALSPRANQVVRIKGEGPVGDAISPIIPNSIIAEMLPVIEFTDQWKEAKTGISRFNQGLDPDALNNTATGISLLQNAANQRVKFLARTMAETGFKDLGRKLLRLVVNHQERERTFRLRNEWISVQPWRWNAEMDVTINVGIGYGNKAQEAMMLDGIMAKQEKIIAYQGTAVGEGAPLIDLKNVRDTFEEQVKSMGWRNADKFMKPLSEKDMQALAQRAAQQPAPPDPEMIKLQIQAQAKQAELQMRGQDQERSQAMEVDKLEREHERKVREMLLEHERKVEEIRLENERQIAKITGDIQLMQEKARLDIQLKERESEDKRSEREADRESRAAEKAQSQNREPILVNTVEGGIIYGQPQKPTTKRIGGIQRDNDGRIMGAEIIEEMMDG